MAPLVLAMKAHGGFEVQVCVTGQHREMLDPVLRLFGIVPEHDLNVMRPSQSLKDITVSILDGLAPILEERRPDYVLVHGDTTTTFSAALAAYYRRIPVGHVEAGLRTGNNYSPWPEEGNRRLAGVLAEAHFAPTDEARQNLLRENVADGRIVVTGNTVIDALLLVGGMFEEDQALRERMRAAFGFLREGSPMVLITAHRRENFGQGIRCICGALKTLAGRHPEADFVYPLHLNPKVRSAATGILSGIANVHLVEHQEYAHFVYLMHRSRFILTDSGGIQEEAPSLGKPVLVMREFTERPEAVAAGTVRLVGSNEAGLVEACGRLLTDEAEFKRMAFAHNPYGDGQACRRIMDFLLKG